MSDAVVIQLISAIVTLLALLFHRIHGSHENQRIQSNLNGDRAIMLARMDAMQLEISRLTGANIKLEAEKVSETSVLPNTLTTIIKKLLSDKAGLDRVPNILVIEDNVADRELMRLSIKLVGGNAICVSSGEEGLKKLATDPHGIDMIFLDMNLPGMNGVMVIRKIREISNRVPVVFVTGTLTPQALEEATKHGSVSMLVKPLERASLRDLLSQHNIPFSDSQADPEKK